MFNSKAELTNSLSKTYDSFLSGRKTVHKNSLVALSESRAVLNQEPEHPAQQALRPLFGKIGICIPSIGDHPDFLHLKGTQLQEYCAITTMFMDLESSTRLGLLYAPQDVFRIKNAFISTAIEIIKAFDGHVHRIMGDAVMAYFGGKNEKTINSAINALNCSAVLNMFVEKIVIPKLQDEGFDRDFGIRIGLDHGPQDKVLWSSYGFSGMEEVTATSYFVDVASKLQHSAGRNQIMMGQTLKELLDFPEELLDLKTVIKDGVRITEPILKPNLTNLDGEPVNYKQFVLRWEDYLKFSPLAQVETDAHEINGGIKVALQICDDKNASAAIPYSSTSFAIPKGKWIKFCVSIPFLPRLPYRVRFTVENHGQEAFDDRGDDRGNHYTDHMVTTQYEHKNLTHWEHTQYRGLQYMTVEAFGTNGSIGKVKLGIYIE
jgi:adenylate cyclase